MFRSGASVSSIISVYMKLFVNLRLDVGCISDVFVNEVAVDFENALEKERISAGCTDVVDLCAGTP